MLQGVPRRPRPERSEHPAVWPARAKHQGTWSVVTWSVVTLASARGGTVEVPGTRCRTTPPQHFFCLKTISRAEQRDGSSRRALRAIRFISMLLPKYAGSASK